jgi:hypothetical protein
MSDSPANQRSLRALQSLTGEFISDGAAWFEDGRALAVNDVARLEALASRLSGDLADWITALEGLDLACRRAPDVFRASRLLLESVFDEALEPAALRVLAAALDLALC